MLTGGCSCGRVRYEAHGTPFHSTICHCVDCRRLAGAPFVAWFSVRREQLRFVAGEPKRFASSAPVMRSFCADCGTPLTFQHRDFPDEVDITTCSLDQPDLLPPQDQVRMARRLPWIPLSEALPTFPQTRLDGLHPPPEPAG